MTYEEIYKKYRKRIEAYCEYRLDGCGTGNAEDLASEVFLLLYQKWEGMTSHEEAHVLKWLYSAALQKLKESRRNSEQAEVLLLEAQALGAEAEAIFDADRVTEDLIYEKYLQRIKAVLKDRDLQTFEMKVERQYTMAQIAAALGEKTITVKIRWCRVQHILKKEIPELFCEKV